MWEATALSLQANPSVVEWDTGCLGRERAVEITISVPDAITEELERFRDRLPEALARGLRELAAESATQTRDESEILDLLTSQPSPDQVLAIRPSLELQMRTDELLERSKQGALTRQDETELERHLLLEHIVRLAKAHAYRQLHEAT